MSKRIEFRATAVDQNRLYELTKKLGFSITAVIREAIRLFHKKEISNVSKALLFFCLLLSSVFSHAACTITQNFHVNNAWLAGQQIPYGMVMEIFNPVGSGCDIYITGINLSAGSNAPYIVFGTAFANSIMPGCASNTQTTDLQFPFTPVILPGGIAGVGLPCGAYFPIGTVSDARWVLASGKPYEEDFGDKPRHIPPGTGYSIWTSPAGYPVVQFATGDLAITLDVKTCPLSLTP